MLLEKIPFKYKIFCIFLSGMLIFTWARISIFSENIIIYFHKNKVYDLDEASKTQSLHLQQNTMFGSYW